MTSVRAVWGLRIGLFAATAALILVGASLNASGRVGWATALAGLAGLIALAAGVVYRRWRFSVPAGAGAVVLTLLVAQFNPRQGDLLLQLAGLIVLGAGGAVGRMVYERFTETIDRQAYELEHKQRAFLAATSEVDSAPAGDIASLTANIARQVGADFACCSLAAPDERQFVPQTPGVGLEHMHPLTLNRQPNGSGPLLAAIESGRTFSGEGNGTVKELFSFLPDDLHVHGAMAVPMPIGDRVGGFVLLGRKAIGFGEDDRRLATTLMIRAGAQLASAHAVALSQKESARYSLMNELVKEASGKTMSEVLDLVLDKGTQLIRYDAGRVALFQADDTYVFVGEPFAPAPIDGPMAKVRRGDTVLRSLVTVEEGIFSGVKPSAHGGTANEALIPIRAQHGVLGAICLGRNGSSGFNQRDVAALDELGSIAGVAVENSRILQAVTGQASKLDTALDALGEVSQALTTVTQGSKVLEQKTLETAVRVTGATAGLLTRSTPEGNQSVIMSLGFPSAVNGLEFQNGQGIVGAVMLRGKATAVPDISASFDLQSPPDLVAYGLQAAICVPMLEDGRLWGTLSAFDVKKREWTTDDNRVLATLGNQGVVAVRNAELYDNNQRSIWELKNLQEALQAATSTLDLNQVL